MFTIRLSIKSNHLSKACKCLFLQAPGISRLSPQAKFQCQVGYGAPRGLKQKQEGDVSPKEGIAKQFLSGVMGTFPCPQLSPTVGPSFLPRAASTTPNEFRSPYISWQLHTAVTDALPSQAPSREFSLVKP